jgi:ubiquinone/menaquinone biosynthesis C-methylase UbiE
MDYKRRNETDDYRVDLDWTDDDVVSAPFRLDTEYVFNRMTETTLAEVERGNPRSVLDVGCGRGFDALRICRPGRLVVGLEPSRAMLKMIKKNDAHGGLQLVQGIAEQPPFKEGSFDRVMCKGALDHFYDPRLSISRMYENLKPGGLLVVAVANFESLSCRLARIISAASQKVTGKRSGRRRFWDPPEDHQHIFHYIIFAELISARFSLERIEGVSIMWGFPYWGGLLDRLPRELGLAVLAVLGSVASRLPFLGDVLVAVARRP